MNLSDRVIKEFIINELVDASPNLFSEEKLGLGDRLLLRKVASKE